MAVVGEAYIIIRPITAGFQNSVTKALSGTGSAGSRAGSKAGTAFHRAFGKSVGSGLFKDETIDKALKTQKAWASLSRTGYTLQAALSQLVSGVGALAGGLVAISSAALAAVPSVIALAGAFVSLGIGLLTAKMALSGVFQAVGKLNKQTTKGAADNTAAERRVEDARRALTRVIADNEKAILKADKNLVDSKKDLTDAQKELTKALEEGNEQIQQLGFDAEDAALAEVKAANELEDARKTLARVQDLPPNSRARREAELAYKEADLNLRRAKDRNSDLAKEQMRLAKEGVEGTDVVIKARKNIADAEEDVVEAQKASAEAAVDAAQREEDARRDLARAKEDLKKGSSGGAADDPLAGLTESQKVFAKYLASLKPKIDELKEAAAATFLPKLQKALDLLFKGPTFQVWKTGLGQVGDALGNATISIAQAISDAGNLKDLGQLFEDSSKNIETLGRIIGNTWGALLGTLNAAQPVTEKFLGWLERTTAKWENWLDNETNKKKLEEFFNEAGRVAAEFGTIFGNTFGGVFNIIKANTGPGSGGQILLDYFKDITANFKEFSGSASGQNTLKEYFADAAENTKSILGFFGDLFKIIFKLGADPNVKVFWDTLKGALPSLEKILIAGNEAGPVFADLLVQIARIFGAFAGESGSLRTFFGILRDVAKVVANFAESPIGGFIIKVTGYVSGFALAFGLLGSIISSTSLLFLGIFARAFNMVSKIFGALRIAINLVGGAIRGVVIAFNLLKAAAIANPVGAIIVAIGVLIGLFVLLYNKNEAFREFVQKVWEKIKEVVGAVVDWFMETLPKIWDGIKAGLEAVWEAIKFVWDLIIAGVKIYIETITTVISFVWDVLKKGLELVWEGIKLVWDFIVDGVKFYIDLITTVISFVWDVLKKGLDIAWTGIKAVWEVIKTVVKTYIDTVTGIIKFVWDVLKTGLSNAWEGIKGVWNTIIGGIEGFVNRVKGFVGGIWSGLKDGLQGAWEAAKGWWNRNVAGKGFTLGGYKVLGFTVPKVDIRIPELAQGGVIPASPGGTLARIGEAGRPERVEPLDPDGLSKRDKAMIALMTQGQVGGATFNVYPSPGMDEVELAAMISRQIAFQTRKGAA